MVQKVVADSVTDAKWDAAASRLEVAVRDRSGQSLTLSLSPTAISALAVALAAHDKAAAGGELTRIPRDFAIGHGRYEPMVLLRFEDEAPYGLSRELALQLGEALVDEVVEVGERRYPVRQ
jgi:hypothetical protein